MARTPCASGATGRLTAEPGPGGRERGKRRVERGDGNTPGVHGQAVEALAVHPQLDIQRSCEVGDEDDARDGDVDGHESSTVWGDRHSAQGKPAVERIEFARAASVRFIRIAASTLPRVSSGTFDPPSALRCSATNFSVW